LDLGGKKTLKMKSGKKWPIVAKSGQKKRVAKDDNINKILSTKKVKLNSNDFDFSCHSDLNFVFK